VEFQLYGHRREDVTIMLSWNLSYIPSTYQRRSFSSRGKRYFVVQAWMAWPVHREASTRRSRFTRRQRASTCSPSWPSSRATKSASSRSTGPSSAPRATSSGSRRPPTVSSDRPRCLRSFCVLFDKIRRSAETEPEISALMLI